jgi:putative glycosyltransferase (TIGR04372 family)
MSIRKFIFKQIREIRQEKKLLLRKILLGVFLIKKILLCILAIPPIILIRLIRPIVLLRWGNMFSNRIGHFAANTELYLCERDAGINRPKCCHIDIFYMGHEPICNFQLAKMWKKHLRIVPAWLMSPIASANRLIPGGKIHEIGNNIQNDRDINNLLDKFPPHLEFSKEEERRGREGLIKMGIPADASFICLAVRDSTYLSIHLGDNFSYHNYRDTDIQNYVLAAEYLASRGYFVIRMGVNVDKSLNSTSPKVIDYASNGMRSDFMDIYLGAKCFFCISVGTGFDAVPFIFHRPTVFVNMVPVGYLSTFRINSVGIVKHYFNSILKKKLTLEEIFFYGIGFSTFTDDYESKDIQLIENTPTEIRDTVIEMLDRLNGIWEPVDDDQNLQKRFWELFPINVVDEKGVKLHGSIKMHFGAQFLRNNRNWLEVKSEII